MKTKRLGPLALLCVSLILVPASAFADGTITGVVIDGFTGQPVRGATLTVEGTDISFSTGVGGDFRGEAPAGTYTVNVNKDGFESHKVTDVVVAEGGNADFAVVILPLTDASPAVAEDQFIEELPVEDEPIADSTATDDVIGGTVATAAVEPTADPTTATDSGVFVGEITVAAAAAEESTEQALLVQRKQAAEISDAIYKQEISKNAGGEAARA